MANDKRETTYAEEFQRVADRFHVHVTATRLKGAAKDELGTTTFGTKSNKGDRRTEPRRQGQ